MSDGAKVLITGGSGFLGAHISRRLLRSGCKVRILDIQEVGEPDLKGAVEYLRGDIRDAAVVERAVAGTQWVFHNAAALPISRAGREFEDVNVHGTQVVLEACLRHKVEKVIHISSSAVYLGKSLPLPINEATPLCPMGHYGASKLAAESVCTEYRNQGLKINILRSRTLVGSGRLGIFGMLFDWIRAGKRIYILGPGNNPYQLLSAQDMAQACWLAASCRVHNEDFCVGTDRYQTVRQDLEALVRHAGTASRVCSIPPWVARTALGALDILRLSPLVDLHYKTPHKPFYFDITKARTMLGFAPKQSNVEMLTEAYDWYLENRVVYGQRYGHTHRNLVKQGMLRILRALS